MARRGGKPMPPDVAADAGLSGRSGRGSVDAVYAAENSASTAEGAENGRFEDDVYAVDAVYADPVRSRKLPPVEKFPLSALSPSARRLAVETAESMGCPIEYAALPMLISMSGAIGNTRELKVKEGHTEHTRIFGAVVGPPGAMKSPPMEVVTQHLQRQNRVYEREHFRAMQEYDAGLRDWEVDKKDAAKDGQPAPELPEKPIQKVAYASDTTIEAYEDALKENPRGVPTFVDELSGWVQRLNQYRGGAGADKKWWLERWGRTPINNRRKSREGTLIVHLPHVCLYGTIQPTVLPSLAEDEDGLIERFLLVYPDQHMPRYRHTGISEAAREGWKNLLDQLLNIHLTTDDELGDPLPTTLEYSKEAHELYVRCHDEISDEANLPGFPPELWGTWSKLKSYLARLALVVAVARCAEERLRGGTPSERVELEDARAAADLVEYFKSHAKRLHIAMTGGNSSSRLLLALASLAREHGGTWEGESKPLYDALDVDPAVKGSRAEELTKRLKKLADVDTALKITPARQKRVDTPEGSKTRRIVTLHLENSVNSVNSVNSGAFYPENGGGENGQDAGVYAENSPEADALTPVDAEKASASTASTAEAGAPPREAVVDLQERARERLAAEDDERGGRP